MGAVDNPKFRPETMEGQVVRISDLVAYANHDLDDAIRAGIITIKMHLYLHAISWAKISFHKE